MNRAQRRMQERQERQPRTDTFAQALRWHQAGQLGAAERGYRQVLAANPRHADSLHLLGVLALQKGWNEDAAALIGRAIAIDGAVALYHCNLGNALQELGRLEEAIASFRQALDRQPDAPEVHFNLGNAYHAQRRLDAAVDSFQAALALRPGFAAAHYNLGNALRDQGRLEEAVACYRRACSLQPDLAAAHTNLGRVLAGTGRPAEALASFRAACALRPDDPRAHDNLGGALADLGLLPEACARLREAVRRWPDDAALHFTLATVLLTQGELAAGWTEYEWRWRTPQMMPACRPFPRPQWRGEPAAGARLLIHAEQGYGDTLQFCRYATMAGAAGLQVILEAQPELASLLRTLPGTAQVIARGSALPDFDLHCPLLSLPAAFGTTLSSIPASAAYLHADAGQTQIWRDRLAALDAGKRPRVGLAWAGGESLLADARRSLDPTLLAPVLALPGMHCYSLQKERRGPAGMPLNDMMDQARDFADTAALIANLDLVISVDTAVAHLAAAMGKPVWLLNRADTCWRWLTERDDTPWYPSMRLYRQPRPGAWDAVIPRIVTDLRDWCTASERAR